MAQGITDSSLKFHLQNAKAHGVTQKEIAAIITHAAFYAGWPKGWAVFNLAKEVWEPGEGDLPYEDEAANKVYKYEIKEKALARYKTKYQVVSTSLYVFSGPMGSQYNYICAGVLITIIPALIIFLLCQDQIYSGMAAGAVKG